jgi:large repetitive protein
MPLSGSNQRWKGLLANTLFAVSSFLLPVENAFAVANISLSTSFQSVDGTRNFMDSAGTWDTRFGGNEITDGRTYTIPAPPANEPNGGDIFTLTVQNTAPVVFANNAFRFDIDIDLPAGFRLPLNNLPVLVAPSAGCAAINNVTATQSGNTISINPPGNPSLDAGCTYTFTFGITTDDGAPASAGINALTYNFNYDENPAPPRDATSTQTLQNVTVNPPGLIVTKTADPTVVVNGGTATFFITVENSGTGGMFNAVLTDVIGSDLSGINFTSFSAVFASGGVAPLPSSTILGNQITFDYIPADVRILITVESTVNISPFATGCPVTQNDAVVVDNRTALNQTGTDTALVNVATFLQLSHDLNPLISFCELCGVGEVHVIVNNQSSVPLTNIIITESLLASGLTYDTTGVTTVSIDGAAPVATGAPTVTGANNEILTWDQTDITQLAQLNSNIFPVGASPRSLEIIFPVVRAPGFNEEGIITAVRDIQTSASFILSCDGSAQSVIAPAAELPIQQPLPQVIKLGRNTDAGQLEADYSDPVFGHIDDDIIWRVEIQNLTGLADLQNVLLDDNITPGNFDINFVCDTPANAQLAADGTPPGLPNCYVPASTTVIPTQDFDDPFGNPGNDRVPPLIDIDVAENGSAFIYYVGRILGACTNEINTGTVAFWGCEEDNQNGGTINVPASNGGVTPFVNLEDTAALTALPIPANLNVQHILSGISGAGGGQPVGSKGLVTVIINNQTGTTVRNIRLTDILPAEYVIDPSVPATVDVNNLNPAFTVAMAPAYGNAYLGMIDTVNWTNPDVDPLSNTIPEFSLTSSTTTGNAAYDNMIRNGDTLTITFRIILTDPAYYDLVADIDITPEVNSPAGSETDPLQTFQIRNRLQIDYDDICPPLGPPIPPYTINLDDNFTANPEDLDVSISDALFILTNDPGTPLALNVLVTNNGGHDADDFYVYVTFGAAMAVQAPLPAGCVVTTNPPPHPVLNIPADIPATASVYRCDRNIIPGGGVIAPGATQTITFNVLKTPPPPPAAPPIDDDLTFRADVIGEITLSDNFPAPAVATPLTFPVPASIALTTPNLQLANNYSLDSVRSRVLGFNLMKRIWYCSEGAGAEPATSVPPPLPPVDLDVQIGEDCNYFIESGGWFGFLTPGFTLIAVENVVVIDDLPDGQGFIPFGASPYHFTDSTANISLVGANGGAGTTALDETDISWNFNAAGNGITIKDEFFRVNFKTRLLNDPVDLSYPVPGVYAPNLHGNISTNIARTSFDAVFNSVLGNVTIAVSDSAGVPGYPVQSVRQVDLTEIEPNLIITKTVCNETLNGVGPNCNGGIFSDPITAVDPDAGDTQDEYIYRITITNEASSGGIGRSPAYNVILTDVLDASDLMMIAPGGAVPFNADNLDNDGDGAVDGADGDGEFFSLTENLANGTTPATFVISNTHSVPLQRIDPGDTVTFYYRIDPDDAVSPAQILQNTISVSYDSLEGDFGNQNVPQLNNNEATLTSGRARIYNAIDAQTSAQILPLLTERKRIIQVSNTPAAAPGNIQNVVVGEEIEYELRSQIPVANIRNFTIRDELPAGIRCVDAQTVDLNAPPYDVAGFVPGGVFVPTCTRTGTNDFVEWDFGNQQLTAAIGNSLFDFIVSFIARVENTDGLTDEGCNIRNGGSVGFAAVPVPAACSTDVTLARLTYLDQTLSPVTLNFDFVDITVREPVIAVTKSFAPIVNADADDQFIVTVTATNNGTATAYNLQILDNLNLANMAYLANLGGTDPPDTTDTLMLGANQPVFSWENIASTGFALDVGETISFTFEVQVNDSVQPREILDNAIEARWTSLPDLTALPDIDTAAARTIEADGDSMGMRNGQLTGIIPVSANPPNDYNVTVSDSVTVPPVTMVKNALDAGVTRTIGEHKQFEIVISLPEGISNNVTVADNLATGTVSYFIENNAGFDVTYSFQDISSINGLPPSEAAFVDNTANATDGFPVDGSSGAVTWNIGTIDTDSENDQNTNAVNPQITITYFARINNDVATNLGEQLQNTAGFFYTNGQTGGLESATDTTPVVTVTEPVLTVTETVTNLTSPGSTDAGDILEYVITVPNSGDSTAFDINIIDIIPSSLALDASFTPTASITSGGVPASVIGFISVPLNGPAGPLIWGRDNLTVPAGDETLDVPANETLVLTYRVVVQNNVEPNQNIVNDLSVDWTSTNGANVLERTGTGCPTITAPDDYCAVIAAAPVLQVIDINNIAKNRTDDTFVTADAFVRIGDTVEYTLTLNLQEGTTDNIVLTDVLPAGIRYGAILSINGIVAAPFTNAAPFQHGNFDQTLAQLTGDETTGTTIAFNIGTLINDGITDPNNAADNDFVIVYSAQIVNDDPVAILPQLDTTNLANTVALTYLDVNGAAPVADPRLTDTETIVLQQPVINLANISKTRVSGALSGSVVSSGETMDFQLRACNTGDGPAYDLMLQDILPIQLDPGTIRTPGDLPNAGTPPIVSYETLAGVPVGGPLTEGAANDYIYTAPAGFGGTMQFEFINEAAPLLADQCAIVRFDIDVISLGGNLFWDNQFQVFEYFSLDADNANIAERQRYGLVGPVLFNMNTVTPNNPPQKLYVSPADHELAVGEFVTYRIVIPADDDDIVAVPNPNPMRIDLFDVEVTDDMSPNLTIVSIALDTTPGIGVNGTQPYGVNPGETIDSSASSGNLVRVSIPQISLELDPLDVIPPQRLITRQAFIVVTARVNNTEITSSAVPAFNNGVRYTFAGAPGGGPISPTVGTDFTDPADDVFIVEPSVTLVSKVLTSAALVSPDAGDRLSYQLTLTAAGGAAAPADRFSDAFDIVVIDSLGPGLVYAGNPVVTNSGPFVNTIGAPTITGDGSVASPQILTWDLSNSNIDIQEGDSITVDYDVIIADSAIANQALDNSAIAQWTSLDGIVADERDASGTGDGGAAITHIYQSGPQSGPTVITTTTNLFPGKTRLTDTFGAGDTDVRIGDLVDYELRVNLQEGTSQNTVLQDILPQGLQFEGIVSINAVNDNGDNDFDSVAPFQYPQPSGVYTQSMAAFVGNADARVGPTTLNFNLGNIINTGREEGVDIDDGNDDFVLVYRARVLNLTQTPISNPTSPIPLQNNVDFDYQISAGVSGDFTSSAAPTLSSTQTIQIRQPNLTVTSKTLVAAGGDNVVEANEVVTYTVVITNSGESIAHDVIIRDTLPLGFRLITPNVLSVTLGSANPFTTVPVSYISATGSVTWNFDSPGVTDQIIIPGDTLTIVYEVFVDSTIGAGRVNMINQAQVLRYHSFDNEAVPTPAVIPDSLVGVTPVRELYGPSAVVSAAALSTEAPEPLAKQNPGITNVTIGEPFNYRITLPNIENINALYDVRVLDSLDIIAAVQGVELTFVGATKNSASGTWTPVNTGTSTSLIVEDTTNGIDIPVTAGTDRATIDLTLMLRNTAANVAGDTFTNTASYTFNSIDENNASQGAGGGQTTAAMTIVEPDLTMEKRGPAPATARFGVGIPYTLVVENVGTSAAYDMTLVDFLPSSPSNGASFTGSACDVQPDNFTAQVFQNDETTAVTGQLVLGTDFTISYTAAPTCELRVTTLTAAIPPTAKLIVTYNAYLDVDSSNGAELTNTAGVAQYFSQDTVANTVTGEIREYTNTISLADGVQPYESIFTIVVQAPILLFQKTVEDITKGRLPAVNTVLMAEPGDVLRYTITVQNLNPDIDVTNFTITDDPDRLSPAPGYFVAGTLNNITVSTAATNSSIANAGTHSTGLVDLSALSLTEAGGAQDSLTITFEIQTVPVAVSGSLIQNQAVMIVPGFTNALSDDPNINGADNPAISGDEDTTNTILGSAPSFRVEKTVEDLTGETDILRVDDVLRYTITAKNIGVEDSFNTLLRDHIPANTSYVADSTFLNGVAVADVNGAISPLQDGIFINGLEDSTAGYMRADVDDTAENLATITFEVRVASNLIEGTVISNQAFVLGEGEGSGPFPENPSDNPATELINDPTQIVVGLVPVLDAQKTVSIVIDGGDAGVANNGDTLEYRIAVSNVGSIAATSVNLIDAIPANSTYVAGSFVFVDPLTQLSTPVADSLLASTAPLTVRLNSSDLPVHNQQQNDGQLNPGQSVVMKFRVLVASSSGDISNQGLITSAELPDEPTDVDGNDENGDQPTVIGIGVSSDLLVTKEVTIIGGGLAQPEKQLEYNITVRNTGSVNANNVVLTDLIPAGVSYVSSSARLNGSASFIGTAVTESTTELRVNYQLAKGTLEPNKELTFSFRVNINADLVVGTTITNTVDVTWSEMVSAKSDTALVDIGGAPGIGIFSGHVWHEMQRELPTSEYTEGEDQNLISWTVEIYINSRLYTSGVTDINGLYEFRFTTECTCRW